MAHRDDSARLTALLVACGFASAVALAGAGCGGGGGGGTAGGGAGAGGGGDGAATHEISGTIAGTGAHR